MSFSSAGSTGCSLAEESCQNSTAVSQNVKPSSGEVREVRARSTTTKPQNTESRLFPSQKLRPALHDIGLPRATFTIALGLRRVPAAVIPLSHLAWRSGTCAVLRGTHDSNNFLAPPAHHTSTYYYNETFLRSVENRQEGICSAASERPCKLAI
jgi:hypothetical protein